MVKQLVLRVVLQIFSIVASIWCSSCLFYQGLEILGFCLVVVALNLCPTSLGKRGMAFNTLEFEWTILEFGKAQSHTSGGSALQSVCHVWYLQERKRGHRQASTNISTLQENPTTFMAISEVSSTGLSL